MRLPELTLRVKVNLRNQHVDVFEREAGAEPEVLYFQRRYVSPQHPKVEAWRRYSRQVECAGMDPAPFRGQRPSPRPSPDPYPGRSPIPAASGQVVRHHAAAVAKLADLLNGRPNHPRAVTQARIGLAERQDAAGVCRPHPRRAPDRHRHARRVAHRSARRRPSPTGAPASAKFGGSACIYVECVVYSTHEPAIRHVHPGTA